MPQEKRATLTMSDIKERLQALLDYWIEHNHEHEKEFRDWAQKAASTSSEVSQQLLEAATRMAEAGNCLGRAQEALMKKDTKRCKDVFS